MKKLPSEFKAAWIKALRSGEYTQTKDFLFDGKGYCCLGVACKVVGVDFVLDPEDTYTCDTERYFTKNGNSLVYPSIEDVDNSVYDVLDQEVPAEVLKSFDGLFLSYRRTYQVKNLLSAMNDIWKYTFPQIADWIEANL